MWVGNRRRDLEKQRKPVLKAGLGIAVICGVLAWASVGQAIPLDVNENTNPTIGSFTEAFRGSGQGHYPVPTVWDASISGTSITMTGVTFPDIAGSLLQPGLNLGSPGTLNGSLTDRGDGTFRVSFPNVTVAYSTTDGFSGNMIFDFQTSGVAPGSPGATIAAGCGDYSQNVPIPGADWNPGTGDLTLVGHACYTLGVSTVSRAFQVTVRGNMVPEPGTLLLLGGGLLGLAACGRPRKEKR